MNWHLGNNGNAIAEDITEILHSHHSQGQGVMVNITVTVTVGLTVNYSRCHGK